MHFLVSAVYYDLNFVSTTWEYKNTLFNSLFYAQTLRLSHVSPPYELPVGPIQQNTATKILI
jgi:hypothetical protein